MIEEGENCSSLACFGSRVYDVYVNMSGVFGMEKEKQKKVVQLINLSSSKISSQNVNDYVFHEFW